MRARFPAIPEYLLLLVLLLVLRPAAAEGAEPAAGELDSSGLRWGRIGVVSDVPIDTLAWREALDLEGRRVQDAPLEPALRRGLAFLAEAGYPFAEARPEGIDFRGDRLVGRVLVEVGNPARIEGVRLEGANVTRESTALRVGGITAGQPYTGAEDRRLRERLSRSGLFTNVGEVEVEPGSDKESVVLRIPVDEPAYTRFSGLLGVSGPDSEITGLLDLELTNIAGTARRAAGRWENRGDGLTRFGLSYREPWLPVVPIGLAGDLIHDVNEGLYSYTRWEIRGDVELASQWNISFGRGGSRAVETGPQSRRTDEGYFVGGVVLERRNSVLNPSAGFRLALESARGEKTVSRDSTELRYDWTRWDARGEGFLPAGRHWLGMFRTRFQFLDTPEDSVPRWDLFAIGGATTLRGYREDQFLTRAAITFQSEWRWVLDARGSALYVFADGGFIAPRDATRLRDSLTTFTLGTGVGVRQASRLGILGVEYGIAKGESPLDGRIHLRLDAVF